MKIKNGNQLILFVIICFFYSCNSTKEKMEITEYSLIGHDCTYDGSINEASKPQFKTYLKNPPTRIKSMKINWVQGGNNWLEHYPFMDGELIEFNNTPPFSGFSFFYYYDSDVKNKTKISGITGNWEMGDVSLKDQLRIIYLKGAIGWINNKVYVAEGTIVQYNGQLFQFINQKWDKTQTPTDIYKLVCKWEDYSSH